MQPLAVLPWPFEKQIPAHPLLESRLFAAVGSVAWIIQKTGIAVLLNPAVAFFGLFWPFFTESYPQIKKLSTG